MRTNEQIAQHNDLFRSTMISTRTTKTVLTEGVASSDDREAVISAVRSFKKFTTDNDPYGQHDFGKVSVNGTDYFWKIDYYDSNYEYGADPLEDANYCKLLTIMRADEY